MKKYAPLAAFRILGLILLPLAASLAQEPAPRPIELRDLPLLFADDSGIAVSSGVVRIIHPARTRSAPVLEAEKPWESDRVYIYGSVYRDEASGQFRMWYLSRLQTEKNIGDITVPGFRKGQFDVVLYATSEDGLRWNKPSLGLHSFNGSTENNIIFDLHSPSVLLDRSEKDPAKRYKMVGAFSGKYYAAVSPDGLAWTRFPNDQPILKSSDNISLCQDPVTGEYLAFHREPAGVRGRTISLSRSKDFATWSAPQLAFAPDAEDDAWIRNNGQRTEVNNMSVFPHASGFLGFPTIFRVLGVNGPQSKLPLGQSSTDGIIDVQLITSLDGQTWKRPEQRITIISRGERGSFDGGTILGVSSTCTHAGDETWVYYTALTTSHGATIPPKRLTIGRAEWRRHGFVSLDAGINGRVETKPLKLSAPTLTVNANAKGGELRVALLDAEANPIEGYTVEDCEPLTTDATRWVVKWKDGKQAPIDRPIRVVVKMEQTRLYSLSVEGAGEPTKTP